MNTFHKDNEETIRLLSALVIAFVFHILFFSILAKTYKESAPKKPLDFKVVYVKSKKNAVKVESKPNVIKKVTPPKRTPIAPSKDSANRIAAVVEKSSPTPPEPKTPREAPSAKSSPDIPSETLKDDDKDIFDNRKETGENISDEQSGSSDDDSVVEGAVPGSVGDATQVASELKVTSQQLGDNKLFIMPLKTEEEASDKVIEQCPELSQDDIKQARVLTFEFNVNPVLGLPENITQIKKSGNEELDKTLSSLVALMSFDLSENNGEKYYLSIIVILKEIKTD